MKALWLVVGPVALVLIALSTVASAVAWVFLWFERGCDFIEQQLCDVMNRLDP